VVRYNPGMKIVAVALILFSSLLLSAQTASEVEITAEPHHHLELQNDFVRAFKVDIPPHDATLLHRHRRDYFVIALAASDIASEVPGKPVGSIKMQAGETGFHAGEFAHIARNLAATSFPHVDVEVLQPNASYKWGEERGVDVLEGGTREILFVKDGVRASQIELQPHAMIPRHKHVGPHLVVAITAVDLQSNVSAEEMKSTELKPGEVAWFAAGLIHSVMNMGSRDAKFVVLEFPPVKKK
jgi:quercetin dioxygenase-like cupin family protein